LCQEYSDIELYEFLKEIPGIEKRGSFWAVKWLQGNNEGKSFLAEWIKSHEKGFMNNDSTNSNRSIGAHVTVK